MRRLFVQLNMEDWDIWHTEHDYKDCARNIYRYFSFLEYKKSSDGTFKFFFSSFKQIVKVNTLYNGESANNIYCILEEETIKEEQPLKGASVEIKVSTFKHLKELVRLIVENLKDIEIDCVPPF